MEEDTVFITASVSDMSKGSTSFESGEYGAGQQLTFLAEPNEGYQFVEWVNESSGQSYTSNPLSLTISNNTNLVAVFSPVIYNVNLDIEGDGEIEQEIISSEVEGQLSLGSVLKLTAVPGKDQAFFYWNDDVNDIENPKTITIDGESPIKARFNYSVVKDLVGTWEFDIVDGVQARNHSKIVMSIDFRFNVLFSTYINGQLFSQIFTQLFAISSSSIVLGDFAVLKNIFVVSSTEVTMVLTQLPDDGPVPTDDSEIPDGGNEINLDGEKTADDLPVDDSGNIIPPTDIGTSSSTTDDTDNLFDETFGELTGTSSSTTTSDTIDTDTASSTTVTSTTVTSTTESSTTISSTTASCTITGSLASGPASQTVSATSEIIRVLGQFTYNCDDTLTGSAEGLPPGISLDFQMTNKTSGITFYQSTISGTPTEAASGTYNYTVSAVNLTGTASASYSGDITVSLSASTTLVPCSGSLTLTSGPSTQTVSASTAITSVNYLVSTNCTDTTTVSATGLPSGVTMNYTSSSGAVVVSGTPSGAASGTYYYSILAMFAPTSDTTASATIYGNISIAASTASSTTASSCTISGTLTSGPPSQTVSISTAITDVVGAFTYTCSDTLSISATGLPPGVSMSTSGNVATISGTPTGTASGTYNYTVSAVNSIGTASASYSGDITVITAAASSTTATPCSGSIGLTSGSGSQTVSATTAIADIEYRVYTNCIDTTTVSATGLPLGVTMNYDSSSGNITISGTPTGTTSGTYSYTILAMFAPTSDATASATITGSIIVTDASISYIINVTASNSSNYTLSGTDRVGNVSGNDPDLTFNKGDTLIFNVDASGHPFYLKTSSGTGTSNTIAGVTNNGSESATITWTPTTTGTFYYQCSLHGGMVGTITIN